MKTFFHEILCGYFSAVVKVFWVCRRGGFMLLHVSFHHHLFLLWLFSPIEQSGNHNTYIVWCKCEWKFWCL